MRIETKDELKRRLFSGKDTPNSSLIRDVLRIPNYGAKDTAKLDEIIKRTEANSPRLSLFSEFLGCNVLQQVINVKVFPKYKKGLLSLAADKIIKEKYEIKQKLWFDYKDDVRPVVTEEIQTNLDKVEKALVKGYYFLTNKETKHNVIFGIDFLSDFMTGYIAMYSGGDNSDGASSSVKDIVSWAKNNNFLKGKKISAMAKFLKVDNVSLSDVILKDEIKNRILSGTVDMMENMEVYKKNKLLIKRGILMEGEPGTGKTLLAKALCNKIDCTFIWVTADDIIFPSDVSSIYNMARELSPSIVLFEDIDYIGKSRETYRNSSFDKITGELLNQMDGVESNEGIITLASSNYPKSLDKALRNRPGRFDIRVKFELPDKDLREKMVVKFFGEADVSDINIKEVVSLTDGYTGAYIRELATATIMLAVTDKSVQDGGKAIIKKKYLTEAFNELESSRKLDEEE